MSIDTKTLERVNTWLEGNYDEATKAEIRKLMDEDPKNLADAFYRDLEFGTGGMRGLMGPGTNRMNVYTVAMATQGLCNYLNSCFPNQQNSIAIAHDCRINNTLFAETTAKVCAANGVKVFFFDGMRPTPELSFAIRYLGCQSGVVITASHNPKEYNGYKVYWEDGAQLVTPHDKNVINEVQKISSIDEVKMEGNPEFIVKIGAEVDEAFEKASSEHALNPDISGKENIKIVYTPLHGTGMVMLPRVLKANGYKEVHMVADQAIEDGSFPATKSTNPEDTISFEKAIELGKEINADILMATDPDADRIGIAVKDNRGEYILLNGNQTGAVIVKYMLEEYQSKKGFAGNEMTVKTIVTSELIKDISDIYGVKNYDVLTGFKWIADVIRNQEGKEKFIVGLEESYGYMIGDFVRDKDSVTSALILAELATIAKNEGKSIYDKLIDIYLEFGFYKEDLISIYKHGQEGVAEIAAMMENFRKNPPKNLAGEKIVKINDYQSLKSFDVKSDKESVLDLPKSNVLQFYTDGGTKVSMRPSGTEPKIKFYFSVKENLDAKENFEVVNTNLIEKIESIKTDLKL
jgi:phosphoglucomutase